MFVDVCLCQFSDKQLRKIEKTLQEILSSRMNYPDAFLADLYEPPILTLEDLRDRLQKKQRDREVGFCGFGLISSPHTFLQVTFFKISRGHLFYLSPSCALSRRLLRYVDSSRPSLPVSARR